MHPTFLDQTAAHYFGKFGTAIKQHCVVVPSRRAAFFFKQALQQAAGGAALELPRVYAIDDFVSHLSNTTIVDPVFLQLELFDLLKPLEADLDFDQFLTWSGVLLDDFSRIDQFMADARQVFEYMTELKALERWDPDTSTQSPALLRHFRLWEHLHQVYGQLRHNLLSRDQAYAGLAYRQVAENIDKIIEAEEFSHYVFVGLNGLSRSEETIIKYLLKAKVADLYFDTDRFYMKPDPNLKAGHFLRQYKAGLGLTEWNWESELLTTSAKEINLIGVSNATLQGKVTGQIIEELCSYDSDCPTAIVLPDENLLLPVLHSLHDSLTDLNITMGLGLTGTSLFNFVELLFELHGSALTGKGTSEPLYNHKTVQKLLTHPYVLRYEKYTSQHALNAGTMAFSASSLVQHLVKNNLVLLSQTDIAKLAPENPLLIQLFAPWTNHRDALDGLFRFVELFREVYKAEPNAIELEYFYLFYTILRKIDSTFTTSGREFSVRSFRKFLYERIRQTSLPFSGEPVSPLQIMGMLETRAVDFERVIILSVNEDVLPQGRRQSSLLPYDALRTFGLPTQNDQESLSAYYFYRLLQRAKKVYLLHVLPSDTYGANEKSRFILQLQNDLQLQNPNLVINEFTAALKAPTEKPGDQAINIPKDEATQQQLLNYLQKGLSPSALNSFVTCSLQFYFSRIAKLREADAVSETLGADQFGSLVHQVLEKIFEPFAKPGRLVLREDLETMQAAADKLVNKAFTHMQANPHAQTGMNHLLRQVAAKVVGNFLKKQLEKYQSPVTILGLEQELKTELEIPVSGGFARVKLNGLADRIDLTDGTVRIIDYKTGKVEAANLKVKAPGLQQALLHDREADKLRQLWLYKYMLAKTLQTNPAAFPEAVGAQIEPGIFSLRNIAAGFLKAEISFGEDETTAEFIARSEEVLQQLVGNILDPAQPFHKTHDLEACFYCPYTTICSRAEK